MRDTRRIFLETMCGGLGLAGAIFLLVFCVSALQPVRGVDVVPCSKHPGESCLRRKECKLCTICPEKGNCCCLHVDKCTCDINGAECCAD